MAKNQRTVFEPREKLGVTIANASQNPAILKAPVVSTPRWGKQMFCYLALPELKRACQVRNDQPLQI